MIYAAFYFGKPGKHESLAYRLRCFIGDGLTKLFTHGRYSHCELAIPTEDKDSQGRVIYKCYSSSIRDKGVRCKLMPLPKEKWVVVPISLFHTYEYRLHNEETLLKFFEKHKGKPYDFMGALGVVTGAKQSDKKWFCSEFMAEFLGLNQAWRYSPNHLAALFRLKD